MLLTHPWPIARPFIAGGVHTISLQFPRSLRKDRKYCACSRGFDLRAPENLCFGEQDSCSILSFEHRAGALHAGSEDAKGIGCPTAFAAFCGDRSADSSQRWLDPATARP